MKYIFEIMAYNMLIITGLNNIYFAESCPAKLIYSSILAAAFIIGFSILYLNKPESH